MNIINKLFGGPRAAVEEQAAIAEAQPWRVRPASVFVPGRERWVAVRSHAGDLAGNDGGRLKEWLRPDGSVSQERTTFKSEEEARKAIVRYGIKRYFDWIEATQIPESAETLRRDLLDDEANKFGAA